jgi:beta-lactamase class A
VAHKTGTIGGTVNDSGIIYLPDGMGHVAISLFTKDMDIDTGDVEEIIAQISRFVYDYFYFTS